MPDLTATEIKAMFPELAKKSDSEVNMAIGEAYELSDVSRRATAFLAAHLCAVTTEGNALDGGLGEVSGEQLGPQRISYKTQAETGKEAFFTSTKYGRRFLALEKRAPRKVLKSLIA